ncbi:M15 family metallopeptidase [Dysgonomonas sp. Marseille-P4677]|uniref:M15 family metallopeptidase n=1 Tax=Dysgonomonas sp. Marseille-P4677 TaxID=2364790 RepID=UPI0019132BD9|nr:M15 family metallopeptidase [Dysgonomonas sp. Marseille-P4677]MBK5719616.1 M15 family metallopeptidase [Dysgonomonas sp. Marseille-P4677]
MKNKIKLCILLLFSLSISAQKSNKPSTFERYLQTKELVNVQLIDSSIRADLKYATTDNFAKTILYDTLFNIYAHPVAAEKLAKAQKYLKELNPELSLLVYDAVRPLSVQKKMYKVVQNTKYAAYVANPSRTGLHNYGMAIDLTICDNKGQPLDMGTSFDFFGRAAGINKEAELVAEGILTKQQVKNRNLLRKVMTRAGFLTIRGEWWHFNAVSLSEAKRLYKIIE